MILSFYDSGTEKVWARTPLKKFSPEIQRIALRKLLMLDAADVLADLKVPPGNRLELLSGNRAGQYSIRVNDKWRICFNWTPVGPEKVELVDYH